MASIVAVRQRSDPHMQVWLLREQPELCTVFSGHPAANVCLAALLATTLGFWYFMFDPFEAVASFVALPPLPAPAGIQRQNGFLFARSALVPPCRAVGASHSRRRRPAPNALAANSVSVDAIRSVWTSLPVRTRPAPIAMAFVGPVLVRRVRPVGATTSVRARSAMSASCFHPLFLSLLFCGRTPCPRRPSLQYSRPSHKSFTSRKNNVFPASAPPSCQPAPCLRICFPAPFSAAGPFPEGDLVRPAFVSPPVRGARGLEWQRQTFTIFRSVSAPSGGRPN